MDKEKSFIHEDSNVIEVSSKEYAAIILLQNGFSLRFVVENLWGSQDCQRCKEYRPHELKHIIDLNGTTTYSTNPIYPNVTTEPIESPVKETATAPLQSLDPSCS